MNFYIEREDLTSQELQQLIILSNSIFTNIVWDTPEDYNVFYSAGDCCLVTQDFLIN